MDFTLSYNFDLAVNFWVEWVMISNLFQCLGSGKELLFLRRGCDGPRASRACCCCLWLCFSLSCRLLLGRVLLHLTDSADLPGAGYFSSGRLTRARLPSPCRTLYQPISFCVILVAINLLNCWRVVFVNVLSGLTSGVMLQISYFENVMEF